MNLLKRVEKYLKDGNIDEAAAEARLIVEGLSGLSVERILLGDEITCEAQIMALAKKRVQTGAPIQHLLGFSYFMGHKFKVNENVLIPRDETELLVRCAYEAVCGRENIQALDIGTGSGCIACSLALLDPNITALGVDISSSALIVAIENALALGLESRAVFRKSDLFSNIREGEKFDVIISNPPYIPLKERENLQPEVRFEPSLALFAEDELGVGFYERILSQAPKFLKANSPVFFEIGQLQSEIVQDIFLKQGFANVKVIEDIAKKPRVICGYMC